MYVVMEVLVVFGWGSGQGGGAYCRGSADGSNGGAKASVKQHSVAHLF